MPGPNRMMAMKKPKNAKKTIARLLSRLAPHRFKLVIVTVCTVLGSLGTVAGSYFLKPILNDYIVPFIGQQNVDLSGFIRMLCLLGCIYILSAAVTYIAARMMVNISTATLKTLRDDMFEKMQTLPIGYFDKRTHGEVMSLYTNDIDAVRELLGNTLTSFISSGLTIIAVFVMMLVLSPILTGVVILMLAVMLAVIRGVGGRSARYFKKQQESLASVNGYIEEMTEGQRVVKVFCHEDAVGESFGRMNEELRVAQTKAQTYGNVLMPIMGNLSYLNYALVAATGTILAINGMTDIGTIGSFLQYSRSFANPITQMSQQMNVIMTALAGAERIFGLMDEPPETDDGSVTLTPAKMVDGALAESDKRTDLWAWKQADGTLTELRGDVRFEDVSFSYDGEKTVLHDLSLYAKPGQKIAFVGETGAGKTTVTNLINRFYDVQEGRIIYDGIDVRDIRKDDLRRSLAVVLQDTHLFTGTVADNIRYGKLDATDGEVVAAAKLANAHYFISHLPQGYDTVLTSDGANLSQGQRQLLSIARAAVADPPVLILDEATSSVDTRTEALIERGMDKLMAGRTVFVIAHRLSTVRNSNAIMVLSNGRIVERGDHDDLIAQKGIYHKLYTGMSELS